MLSCKEATVILGFQEDPNQESDASREMLGGVCFKGTCRFPGWLITVR